MGTAPGRRSADPEPALFEPISPELALVCPWLASAARGALPPEPWARALPPDGDAKSPAPDAEPVDPGIETGVLEPALAAPERGPGHGAEHVAFDTTDLRLRSHGISLSRQQAAERGGGVVSRWRLVLPRGEPIEADGDAEGAVPPDEIAALLSAIVGQAPFVVSPWQIGDRDVVRLQEHLSEQRRALLRHDPGTRLGLDDENLHQLRVATRRLRAFVRVGRDLVDRSWAAALRAELTELAAATGPVRDLDVVLGQLAGAVRRLDEPDLAAGRALLAELEAERERSRRELRSALEGPAYRRLLDRLARPVETASQPPTRSLRKLAVRELSRLARDVERLRGTPDDAALHKLRIRVKRVRYVVELSERSGAGRVVGAAKALQDLLGAYQDTVVAEQILRERAQRSSSPSIAFVAGRLAEQQRRRRRRLRKRLPRALKHLRRASRSLRR